MAWVLSAGDGPALQSEAHSAAESLRSGDSPSSSDVRKMLRTAADASEHRAVVLGNDVPELSTALAALAQGEKSASAVSGRNLGGAGPVLVFPGQGAQWTGMAARLMDQAPIFAAALAEISEALDPFVDWSLTDVVRGGPGTPDPNRVDVVQPALFAMYVSLAALWRGFGVEPAAVIGHSQGEVAAACVAGALSVEDAVKVVALRSQLLREVAGAGGMASVVLGATEVEPYLERWAGRLALAAVNGPTNVVVSGDADALNELIVQCFRDDVWARRVQVDYASHSPQMEETRDRMLDELSGLRPRASRVPMYSSTTGALIDTRECTGAYWYRNLRQTVLFEEAVSTALRREHRVFIEVGPHPVLANGMQETIQASGVDAAVLATLRRDDGGMDRFLDSLAQVYVLGVPADWRAVAAGARAADPPVAAPAPR
ncbi:acyltransferase domain-containing protein [Streptomyces sp. NPDC048448]|uniref:acyltransferase domain-containing protein n=1 Tax=unclassified Streptomyces TaxID=2593676 RepID=UPI002E331F16|nr:acyltransferase domain-containing protein [Streptomyces sp. NBC_01455]